MGKDGTYTLDASKSPRQIDFIRGKRKQLGIYELDGGRLKPCVGPSDDRPSDFTTKTRTEHSMFVLKRKQLEWPNRLLARGVDFHLQLHYWSQLGIISPPVGVSSARQVASVIDPSIVRTLPSPMPATMPLKCGVWRIW